MAELHDELVSVAERVTTHLVVDTRVYPRNEIKLEQHCEEHRYIECSVDLH